MKFAHLADVHIGAWREPKLADLPDQYFQEAFSIAIAEQVDFIVIAGDLFNTALPGIDHLKETVKTLQLAKNKNIPVYIIPGSHDFSPSGKSMLHVLEEAGLLVDVFKGNINNGKLQLNCTKDEKTGTLLTGILGKKGMLDKKYYHDLDSGFLEKQIVNVKNKVFLFHTSLDELKPKVLEKMDSSPVSMLPKGFDYYAGGHVHIVKSTSLPNYNEVVYPGPVFPASFSELELLKGGNMVIVDNFKPRNVSLVLKKVVSFYIKLIDDSPSIVTEKIISLFESNDLFESIVLLRVSGSLKEGSVADIDFKRVFSFAYAKDAFFVMRNTSGIIVESFEQEVFSKSSSHIEEEFIVKEIGKISCPFSDEAFITKSLLKNLSVEKIEGETNASYEERMLSEAKQILQLN